MKKIEVMLILFALLTGLVFLHASAEEGTHIVILGTSDMHGNIWDQPHPVIAAMNFMGYDAMTLGKLADHRGGPEPGRSGKIPLQTKAIVFANRFLNGDMFKVRITSVQTTTACMEPPLRPA